MGLIDHTERNIKALQKIEKIGDGESLRSDIEQLILAIFERAHTLENFPAIERAVEKCRGDPGSIQSIDLIFHQRDEWADHNRHAWHEHRRKLEAERFSRARWHKREDVVLRHHSLNDLALKRTKRVESEIFFECVEQGSAEC
jgi:hypothetical protein